MVGDSLSTARRDARALKAGPASSQGRQLSVPDWRRPGRGAHHEEGGLRVHARISAAALLLPRRVVQRDEKSVAQAFDLDQ
ncbi:MAG: hypothetical protein MZV70_21210 [Desulfobacterales bacterium]|nr:hypothetical protein [Desulfobacterales bacterium]